MKDRHLFELLKTFVWNALPLIDKAIEDCFIEPTYDKYPGLSYKRNGMPDLNRFGKSPIKINDLIYFGPSPAKIDIFTVPGYKNLYDYLRAKVEFQNSFCFQPASDSDETFLSEITHTSITNLLSRYFLLKKTNVFDEPLLEEIYLPFDKYMHDDELYFDVAAPILFTKFDFDQFDISEDILVRRISDDSNRARASIVNYSPPIVEPVLSAASHEIVFKYYHTKKPSNYFDSIFTKEDAYPNDKFELFFNSIKIIADINTGWAQLLVYPYGWIRRYNADLPFVTGTSVKRYPVFFDYYYWNVENLPTVSADMLGKIGALFLAMHKSSQNKLSIANKRLRYSCLRDNEEDTILDIIIALETLLSDGEKGEITHKLSLRIAKLLSLYGEGYDPKIVFDAMKKIYGYRSTIIHGSSKKNPKLEIKLPHLNEPIKPIVLANNYLRDILKILAIHPQYLNPKEIDFLLLRNEIEIEPNSTT